ncbi:MAG: thioredoxin-disulfide reductase [Oscillospiraceae bacterium]|nr:thioredoxin-disulfide reductase [Oscillospiraceae bacterium]
MKYDIVIIGAGPAGLSAAVYARRAGLTVAVLEQNIYGGQIVNTPEVENYPGVGRQTGVELAMALYNQAADTGADIVLEGVTEVRLQQDPKVVVTTGGEYEAGAVIIANGAKRRLLGCPGEDTFSGRGVSYCATCDGAFFRGKEVSIVGGGNTALEDALFLANNCSKVYLIHRRDQFRGSKILVDAVVAKQNIEILYDSTVEEVTGSDKVEAIRVRNKLSGEEQSLPVSALFVAVGLAPENSLFTDQVELSEAGYIKAGEDCCTSCDGVFVAGDTRTKELRQIVTAAADGAVAATAAARWLDTH